MALTDHTTRRQGRVHRKMKLEGGFIMSSPYILSRCILWIADANIDFINAPLHFARHAAHSNYSQLDPEVRSLNTSISDN